MRFFNQTLFLQYNTFFKIVALKPLFHPFNYICIRVMLKGKPLQIEYT